MPRERYVLRNGELVPKHLASPHPGERVPSDMQIVPDWTEPVVSPVDGSVLTSRADQREHERRNGVVCVGNDAAVREGRFTPEPLPPVERDVRRSREMLASVGFRETMRRMGATHERTMALEREIHHRD